MSEKDKIRNKSTIRRLSNPVANKLRLRRCLHLEKKFWNSLIENDINKIKECLEAGIDINIQETNYTALTWASSNGHTETVKFLIEQGADINIIGSGGKTALIWASFFGHIEIVRYLIEHGALLNVQDEAVKYTALHYAIEYQRAEVVKELLNADADVSIKDRDGKTAFDIAKQKKDVRFLELLRNHQLEKSISKLDETIFSM